MNGMTVQLTLSADQMKELARMVAEQIPPPPVDRYAAMAKRLGEACNKKQAAAELNVSATTLYRMLEDGRIRATSDGQRVDVRSLAEYIEGKRKRSI